MTAPVAAARLLPAYGAAGYDFVYVSQNRVCLGRLSDEGRLALRVTGCGGTAAAASTGSLYVFSGHTGYRVAADGSMQPCATLHGEVRQATAVGDHVVLLVGGTYVRGELQGARVLVWDPGTGSTTPARQVRSEWNPFLLRSVPGHPELLVGVRKAAHFDPVVRTRPFLYRCSGGALRPVWQGTSFSRPFVDAGFVRLSEQSGMAVAALEVLAGGLKMVRAYSWTGASMAAIATSVPASLGDSLQTVSGGELAVFEAKGQTRRLIVLGWGNNRTPQEVTLLQTVARSPWLAKPTSAWTALARSGRRWLVYSTADGQVQAPLPLADTSDLPTR